MGIVWSVLQTSGCTGIINREELGSLAFQACLCTDHPVSESGSDINTRS